MTITFEGWTINRAFKNIQDKCKNIKMLVQSNSNLRTKSMELILKMTISMTYLLIIIKYLSLDNQYRSCQFKKTDPLSVSPFFSFFGHS